MQRTLAIALVATCVVAAATTAFARNGGGAGHRGQGGHGPIILSGPEPTPPIVSRIPAPLAPPAQAPVINGPLSQPAFRGLTGIGQ
jgi:hypothetical protein